MLTVQELRSTTKKELLHELTNARKELVKVQMGVRTKSTKDTSLVKKHKAFISNILTVIKEIDLEEAVKDANKI